MPLPTPAPAAPPAAHFASPLQPWTSPDGAVHLLRPIEAEPGTSDVALGSLMVSGWRLLWDGSTGSVPLPGRLIVRLVLKVRPEPPQTAVDEVLQVGASRDAEAVRTCLTFGLDGGSAQRRPDRTIDGRRYAVWTNGDSGMSQGITATDLRAVVDGACYAVERFTYSFSAGDADAAITLPQARGAQQLDTALASLRLGSQAGDPVTAPIGRRGLQDRR